MKVVSVGLALLVFLACACSGAVEPSRSLLELSAGPVTTESSPAGVQALFGVSAQYTWLRWSERTTTMMAAVRYRNGPFVAPESISWAPVPHGGCRAARGNSEPRRAHFAEFGVGVRSSSGLGAAVWFGEFEAGMAAIRYSSNDDGRILEYGSPFVGLRLGTAWPARSRLSGTAMVGLRVYPGVDHMAASASLGLAWAP